MSVQENPYRDLPWLASYPEHVDWHAKIPVRPVHEMLQDAARLYGSRPAFDFLGRKWTWSSIEDMANRMAKGLQIQGVKKGTRVGLFLPNCPVFLTGYYGVLKAGGTVVNLNPLYPQNELEHMIRDAGIEILITVDLKMLYMKTEELHKAGLKKIIVGSFAQLLPFPKNVLFPLVKHAEKANPIWSDSVLSLSQVLNNSGKPDSVVIDPANDVAVLQYTGGTTGTPKGAMLTHANVTANVMQSSLWFHDAKAGQEKMLGVIPFFHVFAMTAVMNLSVLCGFEIIATPRFDLDDTMKAIDRKKPGIFPAVPAIYNAIANSAKAARYDLRSLKYCISGGAPLPVEVKRAFEEKTGCVVVEGYGLSEAAPVVCVNPIQGVNKPGSIGMPLPGTIVEIRDPETGQPVPRGERGELCVSGPQVMKGYWNQPQETDKVLKDGLLHTGDIATMDGDGYFFIVDRIKDMIITNGYKVYPRNVEEAIYLYPGVEECIVAGLPDKARGEIVKAWVKPKDGQTIRAEDIRTFLKDRLSPMELPRVIEIRDEPLPKTMIGKLSRKDMVAQDTAEKN